MYVISLCTIACPKPVSFSLTEQGISDAIRAHYGSTPVLSGPMGWDMDEHTNCPIKNIRVQGDRGTEYYEVTFVG